jgi:hypothetical protein
MTRVRIILAKLLATFLYVATLAFGLLDVYFVREIVWAIYVRFSNEVKPAVLIGDLTIFIMAIVYMAFVIITGEYHFKHAGESKSWRLFSNTFAVEFFIPILAFFMG